MGKRVENTNQVWVYLSDELKDALSRMATENRLSMSSYMRKLIQKELNARLEKTVVC